jgi:hypothetical protein
MARIPNFSCLKDTEKSKVVIHALEVRSSINFDIVLPVFNLVLNFSDRTKAPILLIVKLVMATIVIVDAGTSFPERQAVYGVKATGSPVLDPMANSSTVPFVA